jgi:hypothetical protein
LIEDLTRLTDDVLQLTRQAAAPDAAALTFLLRQYRATGRADLRDTLEAALGAALERPWRSLSTRERAGSLTALVEALPVADDDRLRGALAGLVESLRAEWGGFGAVDDTAASLDACLNAAPALDSSDIVPAAIDELERVMAGAYRPGEGLAHELRAGSARGRLGEHVQGASALLSGYAMTARLPYAMLAEELMRFARRSLWRPDVGAFAAGPEDAQPPFALNCAAATVLCRLAALHDDGAYRQSAVVAEEADYRRDAAAILTSLSSRLPGAAFECAEYGLALDEWLCGS